MSRLRNCGFLGGGRRGRVAGEGRKRGVGKKGTGTKFRKGGEIRSCPLFCEFGHVPCFARSLLSPVLRIRSFPFLHVRFCSLFCRPYFALYPCQTYSSASGRVCFFTAPSV